MLLCYIRFDSISKHLDVGLNNSAAPPLFFQATSRFLQIGSSTGLSRFVVVMYYLNWQKVKRNSTRSFAKFNGNLWVFVSSLWLIHLFKKCHFLTFERRWILTIIHILFSRVSFPCPLTSVPVSKGKTCWDEVESLLHYLLYPTKPFLHSPNDLLEGTKNFI